MQEWIKALNDEIKPMIGEDRYANGFSGGKTAGSSSNSSAGSGSSSKGKAKKGKGGGGERGVDDKALDQVSWYTLCVCVCVCVCVDVPSRLFLVSISPVALCYVQTSTLNVF